MSRPQTTVLAATLTAFLLAGCASIEQTATSPEREKTRKGAGYGAAAGAVVGLLTAGNNPFKSAMIGAAAGALVGGSVGYYQDKQEAKLRQQLAGSGVDVVRQGDNITLDMPGNVTFAHDSASLNTEFHSVLNKVARDAARVRQDRDRGGRPHRQHGRATSTTSSCRSAGLTRSPSTCPRKACRRRAWSPSAPARAHPVASNDTPDGRAQNRRVEITIVPVTEDSVNKAKQG